MSVGSRLWVILFLIASILSACAPTVAPTPTPAPTAAQSLPTRAPAAASPTGNADTPTSVASPATAVSPTAVATSAATTVAPASPTAAPTSSASTNAGPITVTDDLGRTVTFKTPPQRIISLSPGPTETLYALGAGNRVVATDTYSNYPAENKSKATLNTYPKPNVEQIVALRPDLVVILVEGNEFVQQMDAQHIPVLKIDPKTWDGTLADIEMLGRVTGTLARAQQITANMRERAAAVAAKTKNAPKPTVLYELDASDPTKPYVAGPDEFFGSLVPLAGGTNVFNDIHAGYAQVSAEQIIARNPDIIILADADAPVNPQSPAMVKARTGWSQIAAVRTGRIYPMSADLLSRPGPRLIDGLELMAKLIHPELFH